MGIALVCLLGVGAWLTSPPAARATPANRAALEKHFDKFLTKNLARCATCHLPSDKKNPESLDEFPHNPFGVRLRAVGGEHSTDPGRKDLSSRLKLIAREDSDGDGVDNESELLLGHNPGDAKDKPTKKQLADAKAKRTEFAVFLASYRWQPFEPVVRPALPVIGESVISKSVSTARSRSVRTRSPSTDSPATFSTYNPIDSFIAAEHEAHGLQPRPEAAKEIVLRRMYLDLIGMSPTPEEVTAFANDGSTDAYERTADRLLADPRYGERWGRHWMDVWRYSDWAGWAGGNQIRDSKPHIWRWRDWMVESLNANKPYAQMIVEMLAADEVAPRDTNMLRATGFLVRNYKMLSREQWLEDTVKHTAQAFLGVTMGCAKCHDHMYDPISQAEYYQLRAVFEPHWVRTDHVPGDTNLLNAGLARVFDTDTNPPTYFFNRGDERKPDTNRLMHAGVPMALGGALDIHSVSLPWMAGHPDREEFVRRDALTAANKIATDARAALAKASTNSSTGKDKLREQELSLALAVSQRAALGAVITAEQFEDSGKTNTEAWNIAASDALARQREVAVADARLKQHLAHVAGAEAQKKFDEATERLADATNEVKQVTLKKSDTSKQENDAAEKAGKSLKETQKKLSDADKALAEAESKLSLPLDTAYKRRSTEDYPTTSTGRRLAFARWVVSTNNPLTARVAMNQIWLRHFGQGLVPTPQDFGHNGKPPSHPQLLDWLASEFMARGWDMKAMHKLIVTSSAYRMASTPDEANAKIDPDNTFLWRMNSRRMEAEVVRDNLLHVAGDLDLTMGGPDIDHNLGLKSKRRSIYLRQAAEKEVEFLKIFDGPAVTECYIRRPTVVPQQALAMANSELTVNEAKSLVKKLTAESGDDGDAFARRAFVRILARQPKENELQLCREFLKAGTERASATRAQESLVSVLFNHNDFVTIR